MRRILDITSDATKRHIEAKMTLTVPNHLFFGKALDLEAFDVADLPNTISWVGSPEASAPAPITFVNVPGPFSLDFLPATRGFFTSTSHVRGIRSSLVVLMDTSEWAGSQEAWRFGDPTKCVSGSRLDLSVV